MNLQTHHTGQISGQIPNQAGTMLPGLPQQNGNPMLSQMQNSNVHRNVPNMDPETIKRRKYMQEKIWNFLMQRRQQSPEVPNRRMVDLVKRLEDGLFRNAMTMEEYLNLDTLERRLLILIKRFPTSNRNQQLPQANSSPSVGTMIPTPGFQQTGNSSFAGTSLVDNSFVNSSSNTIASSTVNPGSFFPTQNGSSGIVHGALAGGYQQSSNAFMVNHGGNNMMMSMGAQRMTSQMIPTTGINNSNSNDMIANTSNNKSLKIESSDVGACSDVDSTTASQPTLQKQHVGGQNSRVLHNIGGQMGSGGNSMLQQKNFGITHGPLSGGFGMIGKNMPVMNSPGTTEGHLSGTIHGNSTKPLSQHLDQHQQRPVTQGDAYGIGATGSGNMYIPATTVGSTISNPSLNSISVQSMHTTDSHLMTNNQSNVSSSQQATVDPHSIDQSQKVNFQSQYPVKENLVQPHQQQLFQQPSQQFQQQKPSQNQLQQKRQMPNQYLMRNDSFGQSHLSPSIIFEVKQEIGTEHYNEGIQSKVTHSFHADMQNQFQSNSVDDHPGAAQPFSHSTVPHDAPSLHPQQFVCSTSDFTSPCGGVQPDAALGSQRYSKPPDVDASGRLPIDQTIQNEKYQRVMRQDGAQLNNLSSEESVIDHSGNSRSTEPVNTSDPASRTYSVIREKQFKNQQRWLLFLRHARRCHFLEGKCPEPNCLTAQKLLKHIGSCNNFDCSYPRCRVTWDLVNHHRRCQDTNCPVCIPVKKFMQTHFKAFARSNLRSGLPTVVNESSNAHDIAGTLGRSTPKMDPVMAETPEDLQPPIKRVKVEQSLQSLVPSSGCSVALASTVSDGHIHDVQHSEKDHDYHIPVKPEISDLKVAVKAPVNIAQECPNIEISKDNVDDAYIQTLKGDGATLSDSVGCGAQQLMKTEKDTAQAKLENTSLPPEGSSKSGKPKIKGVSMIELFTPEMVRLHIMGLRQWVGQSKAKAERNQAMEHSMSENSCQLCAVERLSFEPPPVYCTLCSIRIKRNGMYYSFGSGETRYCFCNHCYNSSHGDTIAVDGTTIPKGRVEKKKNDEETEEWWVQCDKCEAWQHQICALFNGRRNNGGEAEYTCPNCYMAEVEMGERAPLPQSAVLGAKDLPRSQLSDHLEQRLIVKLKQERLDRARHQGKSYDEVPGAEELVVRVVSSVDKKLDVKPRFLEIFQEENYPTEYPYKSKAVLLFQRIEGVEVCLFGMYVQEFGSECQQPNNRRVYISYLDSVKYFRPEVKTVSGEALRTFVYHEILIGYLDYCKMRGFTSCYIWACPPLKGEDYILYCHPEIQKTPKSDKLREWYLAMLRKATRENIVVELTNMYEHFFVSTGECKAKVTASRLPYFDGDYWPGAAEDFIYQFQQEEDGRKHSKKGASLKKSITKRALRASGQTDLSSNALKDLMLMHKLGDSITTCKEDFIMVHLQHSCSHCCILIFSGKRWVCKQCKKFHLCDNCYDAERKRDDRERHPVNYKDVHTLYPVDVAEVPDDTKDNENLESEFFDTRQAFLSLCQGNYYQYDTLRRAKHSSMMVLYHLHNPTAPAFVITCTKCNLDIESGQGWRCETCPEYDICNACYQKDGGKNHPHKLTKNQSIDPNAQNKEAKQLRLSQVRKMLDLLVHASQCRSTLCQYPNCRKVKGLFRHGILCKRRAAGGCHMCTKMWQLLQLHARACKESDCNVPRCRDLREHLRRLQHQADSRRRAAVMEMMRQRAAEVAGSS